MTSKMSAYRLLLFALVADALRMDELGEADAALEHQAFMEMDADAAYEMEMEHQAFMEMEGPRKGPRKGLVPLVALAAGGAAGAASFARAPGAMPQMQGQGEAPDVDMQYYSRGPYYGSGYGYSPPLGFGASDEEYQASRNGYGGGYGGGGYYGGYSGGYGNRYGPYRGGYGGRYSAGRYSAGGYYGPGYGRGYSGGGRYPYYGGGYGADDSYYGQQEAPLGLGGSMQGEMERRTREEQMARTYEWGDRAGYYSPGGYLPGGYSGRYLPGGYSGRYLPGRYGYPRMAAGDDELPVSMENSLEEMQAFAEANELPVDPAATKEEFFENLLRALGA